MSPGRRLALRIVSRYSGVVDHQVAEAEGISVVTVRACRTSLGRGARLGHTADETLAGEAAVDVGPIQLSLGGFESMMRGNRGVCG